MEDSIKRFIDIYVPAIFCNLNCHYCYVAQKNLNGTEKIQFKYPSEIVKKAFSEERMCQFIYDYNLEVLD